VLAGPNVELRAVQRTRESVIAKPSFGQASLSVRAVVVEREQFALHATHDHTV
jgi:hypothetical protein